MLDNYTYEYIPWRYVTKETMEFYGVKTKIDSTGKPISLSFNYPNGSSKVRQIDTKEFHSVGEISAYQMLQCPCVSVSSASGSLRDATRDFAWLRDFQSIYLALDSDGPGRKAAADIAKLFEYGRVYDVRLGALKDANAYLQAGKEADFRSIFNSAKKFLPETIRSSLSDFKTILEAKTEIGLPFGPFHKLTEMTYGLRTGETTLVTAPEGVGKTEFLHAIEHGLLRFPEFRGNIAGIFLEETPKRHLQALAGISLHRPVHLPDAGTTADEVDRAIVDLLQVDDRLFLDVQFGATDVSTLLANIRFLVHGCGCRVVFLDHISVAVGALEGDDQRKALDLFFTKAETMVKELDFALIVVSHVNDYGQTRGSRWGGKMADTRIDLDRDTANGSNVLNIYVSKNRFAGHTGFVGGYEFNPLTRAYTLVTGDNDNVRKERKDNDVCETLQEEPRTANAA